MMRNVAVVGLLLGVCVPGLASAQKPLGVTGTNSLIFGVVFPGVPKSISRTDAVNSGQFDISGAKNAGIQIVFTLPATMLGPAGATMPVSFGANDGGYSPPQQIGLQQAFDPRVPYNTTLDKNGRVAVYLGGTANPLTSQRAGTYTGTVTLTVIYFP